MFNIKEKLPKNILVHFQTLILYYILDSVKHFIGFKMMIIYLFLSFWTADFFQK